MKTRTFLISMFGIAALTIGGVFVLTAEAQTLVTTAPEVYQLNGGTNNKLTMSPIGTATVGTECIEFDLSGLKATILKDRLKAVIPAGKTRPRQIYVKCAIKPAPQVNRAPTISGTPGYAVARTPYSFTPTANDLDGDVLTFVIANRPPWALFDASTGKLSGTPADADVGTRSQISITVNDGKGGEAILAFGAFETRMAATPITHSATLSWTPPTQNADGSALTNLEGYRILYGPSATSLLQLIEVKAPRSSYVIDNLTVGTWYFAVRSYNTDGKESVNSNIASKSF